MRGELHAGATHTAALPCLALISAARRLSGSSRCGLFKGETDEASIETLCDRGQEAGAAANFFSATHVPSGINPYGHTPAFPGPLRSGFRHVIVTGTRYECAWVE